MILLSSVLKMRTVASVDGLMRADATIPRKAEIHHLGVIDGAGNIGLIFSIEDPPIDSATQQPQKVRAEDIVSMEFLLIPIGQMYPKGYQFRASVQGPNGPIVVLEKLPNDPATKLMLLSGRGGLG